MAIYYMGDLISGTEIKQATKTIWRNIGDRVLFVKDLSSGSERLSFA